MNTLLLQAGNLANTAAQAVDSWGGKVMNLVILFVILGAIAALLMTAAKRYKRVPPDQALVVYGGGKTQIVTGGAVFIAPLIRDSYPLDLTNFEVPFTIENVPNADRIPITVNAFAICRISAKEESLQVAARTFGQKPQKEIVGTVRNALEGHLRVVIGGMEMEKILSDREAFNQNIQQAAAQELGNIGCEIVIMNIQQVTDGHGYIEALGKPKSAAVKAGAAIKEAEALQEQTEKVTAAQRAGATARANNEAEIAEADRNLNIKKAGYSAEVSKAQAIADQQGPLAAAEASKAVLVAQVQAEQAKTDAEILLQDSVAKKTDAELKATVIKNAEAERERLKIVAEGARQKLIIEAEGAKQKLATEAEGAATARTTKAAAEAKAVQIEAEATAAKTRIEGLAAADVTQKTGEAEAGATKARLLADAEGRTAQAEATKAELLAQAAGQTAQAEATKAELLAQAEGAKELMAAYAGLDEAQAKMLIAKMLIDNGPALIKAFGEAGQGIARELASVATASLSSIDNVTIYDSGNGNGKSGVDRWAGVGTDALFSLLQRLKATGMLPVVEGVFQKLGIDLGALGALPVEASSAPTELTK